MTFLRRNLLFASIFVLGTAGTIYWQFRRRRHRQKQQQLENLKRTKTWRRLLEQQLCYGRPNTKVNLVSSLNDWLLIEEEFLSRIDASRLIGLDCEWVSDKDVGKVALVQLATSDGWCVLIRTCKLQEIPESLIMLFKRYDVLKVGVAVIDDGKKMLNDFGLEVNGTVDLRHLVQLYCPGKVKKLGLQSLSSTFLGIHLDKDWRVRGSSWEDDILDEEHIKYAANDALASVNVGLAVALSVPESIYRYVHDDSKSPIENLADMARNLSLPFADKRFKTRFDKDRSSDSYNSSRGKRKTNEDRSVSKPRNKHCIRKSPLYHNATLQAPDGQLLCVCDIKKAMWYVEKELGTLVQEDPLVVRLKFEPSGRPEGLAGKYYLTIKENICVVCGKMESYLRKYIVPHEYRKFFPEIMRDHQSHDVLLMCTECHQLSNTYDMTLRRQLAIKCNAPIGADDDVKFHEMTDLKAVRSAARALLKDQAKALIPEGRKASLTKVVCDYYNIQDISLQLLTEAANIDTNVFNENYVPHGQRVVEYYIEHEGIIPLEKLWRQNFLDTMKPKFLPPLWSVDHQKHRLDIRAAENRIDPNDYSIANHGQGKAQATNEDS